MKQNITKRFTQLTRLLLFTACWGWAGFGSAEGLLTFEDIEKPKPVFSRTGEIIAAKLVPRAKSTSVVISFRVSAGGELNSVKGVDFMTVDRPEVDVKNFKSAAFEIRIKGIVPGAESKVSIRSDFFTSSTAFYVFNPTLDKPWMDSQALNLSQPERIQELLVTVKDGGTFDADGASDGVITLIGGPRDSFWGYALGTLFIRFFGIFIVLSILMVGMILSGIVFRRFDQDDKNTPKDPENNADIPRNIVQDTTAASEEEVAAIALALHLQQKQPQVLDAVPIQAAKSTDGLWAAEGRKRIMNDRLIVFNRFNRYDN